MPPTFIQSAQGKDAPVAFASDNTLHNTLVVLVFSEQAKTTPFNDPSFTCVDTQGNIYASGTLRQNASGGEAPVAAQIFYVLDAKAGANTVTGSGFNAAVPLTNVYTVIHEFSGVTNYEGSAFAVGTGLSQSSGNLAVVRSVELLFGYEAANEMLAGGKSGQASVTAGVGWTQMEKVLLAGDHAITQYKITSSSGNYASTTTATTTKTGAVYWIEEILAFYGPQPAVETVQVAEF